MIENFKYFKPITFETPLWFDFNNGMIVQVRAVELQDILVPSKDVIEKYNIRLFDNHYPYSIWSRKAPGEVTTYSVTVKGDMVEGWPPVSEIEPTQEELDTCEWVNQIVWIDEPVGHEVQIGSDVFLTFQECFRNSDVSKRRHRNRAQQKLQTWRKQQTGWIGKSHTNNGHPFPDFPEYADKKIYIKR